jgi:hypothetical protein
MGYPKVRQIRFGRSSDPAVTLQLRVLPHFRCRLGGSTRRKSMYPDSLGTAYRPFGRSRFSGSAVRALMGATPACSMGWRRATVSRHRRCGRTTLRMGWLRQYAPPPFCRQRFVDDKCCELQNLRLRAMRKPPSDCQFCNAMHHRPGEQGKVKRAAGR